jgi:hypothetical protein
MTIADAQDCSGPFSLLLNSLNSVMTFWFFAMRVTFGLNRDLASVG